MYWRPIRAAFASSRQETDPVLARDVKPRWATTHECFVPMCELLHTVSANQTCNSTIPWPPSALALDRKKVGRIFGPRRGLRLPAWPRLGHNFANDLAVSIDESHSPLRFIPPERLRRRGKRRAKGTPNGDRRKPPARA